MFSCWILCEYMYCVCFSRKYFLIFFMFYIKFSDFTFSTFNFIGLFYKRNKSKGILPKITEMS